ncbi:MAG: PAS domain-containing protein [Planctomycetes bacterium]|nr:PAS domain-containing protein [Planctomycetota bacterium]
MPQRILIDDLDGGLAGDFAKLLLAAGYEPVFRAEDAAADETRAGGAEYSAALLCGDRAADRQQVGRLLREQACGVVLGVSGGPEREHYRAAMQSGCSGVVSLDSTPDDLAAAFAAATERAHEARQVREESRRQEYRAGELRRRCVEQAERFQESQDTFFLDLSRLMTIITNIMDGIVFVDRAGNVTLLNPGAEDLLGTKSFVAIGKPLSVMQGCEELLTALRRDHARLQSEKELLQTVEVHHNEQDLLYIQCITSRVHDYRGQPAGILSVLKNVTAEFKTDQLKNQYLSIVAHELRTPLTGIKTFSTMLAKGTLGALTEGQHRVCESIREQSVRLEHQIDKLINLGSLESADYGQDREVCPLADYLNGLLLPFEQPTRDRGIALTLVVESEGEQLFVDRADMRRASQALIENAVKFSGDGGSVEVSVSREEGGGLRFRVVDNGIGIDPRYHRRIFEKFFQVEDPLTRHHGGAGLGLFVAKGIVEAHGSRIEVSSQLGQGADFSFVLPVFVPEPEPQLQNDA